ncbi:hypothetical protein CEXT_588861 [Caerostris extrusa]|uniref:Uncharacterized protein n=1 Tax=Caerostris extrusa TaxID=172846 RepID=A0AAV4TR81_CAEEX|nr:hypothetical protein CEXT_588861 [Caerostris extrusa]
MAIPLGDGPKMAIPLGDVPRHAIPLSNAPMAAIPLGDASMTAIPLGDVPRPNNNGRDGKSEKSREYSRQNSGNNEQTKL